MRNATKGSKMTENTQDIHSGTSFVEFRRKVKAAEILSASLEHLLRELRFTGELNVVIRNGQVLKSGYQEGYFRQSET